MDEFEYRSIQITEINHTDLQNEETVTTTTETSKDYLVEEPLDFIFEPNHNPPKQQTSEVSSFTKIQRIARMVSESDGILEYEYKSHTGMKSNIDDDDDEEFFDRYFNDFDYQHYHLNAIIRNVSLSQFPVSSGFGFSLAKHMQDNEHLYYIYRITPDTPADFSLRLGDIILELDEKNLCDEFKSVEEIHEYLSKQKSVQMLVIHESKYVQLKSNNADLIKNCSSNCQHMVIVSWNSKIE